MVQSRAGFVLIGSGAAAAVALVGWIGARPIGVDVLRAGWVIPFCAALHLLQLLLSAIAWRRACGGGGPGRVAWSLIRWIRESINALLPVAQLGGTVVGVRLLVQRGMGVTAATAGTTLDVTLESLSQFLFTLAGMAALAAVSTDTGWQPWFAGVLGLMAVASFGFVLAQRAGLMRLIEWLTARMIRFMPALSPDALAGLHAALMRRQRDTAALAAATALHLVAWVIGVAETWLALWAMGYPIGAAAALAVESLGMAARSAGFAVPGSLGVQEGGFVLAGSLLGLPPDAAAALSMVKRSREVLVGLPGLLAWHWTEGRRLVRRTAAVEGVRG